MKSKIYNGILTAIGVVAIGTLAYAATVLPCRKDVVGRVVDIRETAAVAQLSDGSTKEITLTELVVNEGRSSHNLVMVDQNVKNYGHKMSVGDEVWARYTIFNGFSSKDVAESVGAVSVQPGIEKGMDGLVSSYIIGK